MYEIYEVPRVPPISQKFNKKALRTVEVNHKNFLLFSMVRLVTLKQALLFSKYLIYRKSVEIIPNS